MDLKVHPTGFTYNDNNGVCREHLPLLIVLWCFWRLFARVVGRLFWVVATAIGDLAAEEVDGVGQYGQDDLE